MANCSLLLSVIMSKKQHNNPETKREKSSLTALLHPVTIQFWLLSMCTIIYIPHCQNQLYFS